MVDNLNRANFVSSGKGKQHWVQDGIESLLTGRKESEEEANYRRLTSLILYHV